MAGKILHLPEKTLKTNVSEKKMMEKVILLAMAYGCKTCSKKYEKALIKSQENTNIEIKPLEITQE